METIKIIDLLNKIANDEEVPKFWWNGCIHQVEKDYTGNISIFDTYCKKYKKVELEDLNEEIKFVEEEKEIEKLDIDKNDISWCEGNMKTDEDMVDIFLETKDKINELIDAVNGIRKEK